MNERRTCPRCFDSILINANGRLRRHRRFVAAGTYGQSGWVPCEGSGTKHE